MWKAEKGYQVELIDHRLISDMSLTNWDVIMFGFVMCFWYYTTNDIHLTGGGGRVGVAGAGLERFLLVYPLNREP